MSVAVRRDRRMRVSEFIELIRPYPDDERWELIDGLPVLMAPQSDRHQRIVMNILRRLDTLAIDRGCTALPGLGILSDAADDFAPIPDVVVRCGPQLPDGYARDAVMLAEVLSPSTMSNDRGRKVDFYKTVESLRTFLIVYQDERRVEAWQRAGGEWQFQALAAGEIDLPELGGTVSVEALYANVALGPKHR